MEVKHNLSEWDLRDPASLQQLTKAEGYLKSLVDHSTLQCSANIAIIRLQGDRTAIDAVAPAITIQLNQFLHRSRYLIAHSEM